MLDWPGISVGVSKVGEERFASDPPVPPQREGFLADDVFTRTSVNDGVESVHFFGCYTQPGRDYIVVSVKVEYHGRGIFGGGAGPGGSPCSPPP